MTINRYQAFAEWRIGTHRSSNRGRSVRFFRKTRDHAVIWTVVMRGYYAKVPPSVRDCIAAARCSKETARRIIVLAESLAIGSISRSRRRIIHEKPLEMGIWRWSGRGGGLHYRPGLRVK